MIISFAGHSYVPSGAGVKATVKEKIRELINGEDSAEFYLGGYGDFDNLCACACRELKREYPNIKVVYISPYMTLSEQEKIKEMEKFRLFDQFIYPPIESVPPKFAIIKRNEWMVNNSDVIIAYVKHKSGGAYRTLRYAAKKKKAIINTCDFFKSE